MSALYDSGFYDEADVFLDTKPLDPGTVVVYQRYNCVVASLSLPLFSCLPMKKGGMPEM